MRSFRERSLLCVISLILVACATVPPLSVSREPDVIMAPVGTAGMDPEKVSAILKEANERNKTVEDDPEWIENSYSGLLVRKLSNISSRDYEDYAGYLDDGALYVIVHPAFFTFFHYPVKLNGRKKHLRENAIERLLALRPKDRKFQALQAQERRMRDFIEFKSTEGKLLILITPKNYRRFVGYTYKKGHDEYMRYLNEITNFSKSVIFAESKSPNRGYLTDEDAVRLMEFVLRVKARKVYIGGGYVGRCLEDFYGLLVEDFGREGLYIVPELSDISPRELSPRLAKKLLGSDGMIDAAVATEFMKTDYYGVQDLSPQIRNLP